MVPQVRQGATTNMRTPVSWLKRENSKSSSFWLHVASVVVWSFFNSEKGMSLRLHITGHTPAQGNYYYCALCGKHGDVTGNNGSYGAGTGRRTPEPSVPSTFVFPSTVVCEKVAGLFGTCLETSRYDKHPVRPEKLLNSRRDKASPTRLMRSTKLMENIKLILQGALDD